MESITTKPVDEMTLKDLQAENFEGPDSDLKTCLFESGLLVKQDRQTGDWFCIIGSGKNGLNEFDTFFTVTISERDLDKITTEKAGSSFFAFIGASRWAFEKLDTVEKIHYLKNYLGPYNMFGTPDGEFQMAIKYS